MLKNRTKDKIQRISMAIKHDWKYNKALIAMIAVPVIITIIFNYVPLYGLQIAFKDYHPLKDIWEAEWVGVKYFKQFFEYYKFKDLIWNTISLNVYDILLTPMPLLFAICINYVPNRKLANFVQKVAMLPHFISLVVVCSLVLRFFSVNGIINEIYGVTGNPPVNFLAHGEYFRSIYVWSGVWQNMGFSAILYISALAEVPREQQEAAKMDGANIFQRIRYIDLPSILPLYGVNLLFRFGALLSNNYEKILLLQNNTNLEYSQVISTYSYEIAFQGLIPQYSLATAIGIVTSIINIIMLLAVRKITRKWEHLDE